jgi:hypothetical protein
MTLPDATLLIIDRDEARELTDLLGEVLASVASAEHGLLELPYEDRQAVDRALEQFNERSWTR